MLAALERGPHAPVRAREQRVQPGRDEKVLAAWNGMMLRAFAEAGARARTRPTFSRGRDATRDFLLRGCARRRRAAPDLEARPRAQLNGYLEDHANVADGLVALYEATFDPRWLDAAVELADVILAVSRTPTTAASSTPRRTTRS